MIAAPATTAVDLAEITRIELIVVRRLRERMAGEHRSWSEGTGFDFVGVRDWQPGDRLSAIDWPQSSLTNYAPLVVREFDQPGAATVMAVADLSTSTRCGAARMEGTTRRETPVSTAVTRALAVLGLSAAFFQDRFGLVAFEHDFTHLSGIGPRTGRNHVVHCIDAYLSRRGLEPVMRGAAVSTTLAGSLRTTSLVPFISDFLFDDAAAVVKELALLNATHDVFVVMVDASFAFEMPHVSSAWIEVEDAETGRTRTVSRRGLAAMADRAREWQAQVERLARDADLDVVRVGLDARADELALSAFVAERRLRRPTR